MQSNRNSHAIEARRRGVSLTILIAALAVIAGLLITGCGSGNDDSSSSTTASGTETNSKSSGSVEDPDVADADAGDVQVISDWIGALTEGDTEAAAGYFAIPSNVENGSPAKLEKAADAIAFNESLPCGGELVAAETTGDFTTATFELTERPGGDCGSGTGGEASTSFVIENGEITDWRRVANPGEETPISPEEAGSIS